MADTKSSEREAVVKLCVEAAQDFQDTVSEFLDEFGINIVCFATGRSYGARCVVQWFRKDGQLLNQTLIRVQRDCPLDHTYLHEALLSQRQMARRLRDILRAGQSSDNKNGTNAMETFTQESLHLVLPEDF